MNANGGPTMTSNGWTDAVTRIAPFINRPDPDVVGALNVLASTVTDVRSDLRSDHEDLRTMVVGVQSTLTRLLFAVVALLCAIIAGTVVLLVQ